MRTRTPAQSPTPCLLQHVLLRTSKAHREASETLRRTRRGPRFNSGFEEGPAFVPERMLLPADYEASEPVSRALSDHANAILVILGEEGPEPPRSARSTAVVLRHRQGRPCRHRPQRFGGTGGPARPAWRGCRARARPLPRTICNFLTPSFSRRCQSSAPTGDRHRRRGSCATGTAQGFPPSPLAGRVGRRQHLAQPRGRG